MGRKMNIRRKDDVEREEGKAERRKEEGWEEKNVPPYFTNIICVTIPVLLALRVCADVCLYALFFYSTWVHFDYIWQAGPPGP